MSVYYNGKLCNVYEGGREAYQIYANGKKVWNYSFVGDDNWSACSASCGGGVQYQGAICKRSDGVTKSNTICNYDGVPTPTLSRPCNTQSCVSKWTGIYYNPRFNWYHLITFPSGFYNTYDERKSFQLYFVAHLRYKGRKQAVGGKGCDGSGWRHPGQFFIQMDGHTSRTLCNYRCCTDTGYGMCFLGQNGTGVNTNSVQAGAESVLSCWLGEAWLNPGQTFDLSVYGRLHTDNDTIELEYSGPYAKVTTSA